MANTLPKFDETFIPILDILESKGTVRHMELLNLVREKHFSKLPTIELEKTTKSGKPLIFNRIGWGKSYLKEGGYLAQPERGVVEITTKGIAVLKAGMLTLTDLKKDPDYILCQKKLKEIDPYYFEKVILLLLQKMGYGDFEETPKSGDGGIDGIINQDQLGLEKIFIQAKRYSENKIREKDIRDFIGAMSGDTSRGVFVTTSTFDDGAKIKAKEAHHKIILIDRNRLVELMHKFGIGVQTKEVYEVKEVDEDFFENS